MTQQELERTIREFVSQASGLDSSLVIPGNDNNPRPNTTYASVLLINTVGRGIDSTQYKNTEGSDTQSDANVVGTRHATFSVQFYRNGAQDRAHTLLQYPATPLGAQMLDANDMAWVEASDVRKIDSIVSERYNERAAVDITVCYTHTLTQTVNSIGVIELTLDHSQETDTHEEVTVNE